MPYRIIEDKGIISLEVDAQELEQLFSDAMKGVVSLADPELSEGGESRNRMIVTEGEGYATLLEAFLANIIEAMYEHNELYHAVRFPVLTEERIEAEVEGMAVRRFGANVAIEAEDWVNLRRDGEGGWRAKLTLKV